MKEFDNEKIKQIVNDKRLSNDDVEIILLSVLREINGVSRSLRVERRYYIFLIILGIFNQKSKSYYQVGKKAYKLAVFQPRVYFRIRREYNRVKKNPTRDGLWKLIEMSELLKKYKNIRISYVNRHIEDPEYDVFGYDDLEEMVEVKNKIKYIIHN